MKEIVAHFHSAFKGHRAYSGTDVRDAITSSWDEISSGLELGNAAGIRLLEVTVAVDENRWRCSSATVKSEEQPTDAKGRAGRLIIRHSGRDLAHKRVSENRTVRLELTLPIETAPGMIRIPIRK